MNDEKFEIQTSLNYYTQNYNPEIVHFQNREIGPTDQLLANCSSIAFRIGG